MTRVAKVLSDSVYSVSCPRCHIIEGKRCLDMRKKEGPTRYIKRAHRERWKEYKNAQREDPC